MSANTKNMGVLVKVIFFVWGLAHPGLQSARYVNTWQSACMCPSLGNIKCEDSIDTSTLMSTLPSSTIHLSTPTVCLGSTNNLIFE